MLSLCCCYWICWEAYSNWPSWRELKRISMVVERLPLYTQQLEQRVWILLALYHQSQESYIHVNLRILHLKCLLWWFYFLISYCLLAGMYMKISFFIFFRTLLQKTKSCLVIHWDIWYFVCLVVVMFGGERTNHSSYYICVMFCFRYLTKVSYCFLEANQGKKGLEEAVPGS